MQSAYFHPEFFEQDGRVMYITFSVRGNPYGTQIIENKFQFKIIFVMIITKMLCCDKSLSLSDRFVSLELYPQWLKIVFHRKSDGGIL